MLAARTVGGANNGRAYETAAREQVEYLLSGTPRTGDGAISHRTEQVQLWWVDLGLGWAGEERRAD